MFVSLNNLLGHLYAVKDGKSQIETVSSTPCNGLNYYTDIIIIDCYVTGK